VNWQRGNLNSGKTGIDGTPNNENQYTLEPLGNWKRYVRKGKDTNGNTVTDLDQTRYHNWVNEIDVDNDHDNSSGDSITSTIGENWSDPKYDAAGNMIIVPSPLTPTTSFTLAWDAWNRLVKVTNNFNQQTLAEYQYDGQHHRTVKLVPNTIMPANWDRYDFYETGGWQKIEERILINTSTKTTPANQISNQYIYDFRYIDALAVRDFDSDNNGTLDLRHYYMHDTNYSILALSDTSSVISERYRYDVYGMITVLDNNGNLTNNPNYSFYDNQYTYTGQVLERDSYLYYYKSRYYHGRLGEFISRDLVNDINSYTSFYQFNNSSPINLIDPYGNVAINIEFIHKYNYKEKPETEKALGEVSTKWITENIQGICGIRSCILKAGKPPCSEAYWKQVDGTITFDIRIDRNKIRSNKRYLDCTTLEYTDQVPTDENNVIEMDVASIEYHEYIHTEQIKKRIVDALNTELNPAHTYGCKQEGKAILDIPKCQLKLTEKALKAIQDGKKQFNKEFGAGGWNNPFEVAARHEQCVANCKIPGK
jgi:RHS repeat-associated protein